MCAVCNNMMCSGKRIDNHRKSCIFICGLCRCPIYLRANSVFLNFIIPPVPVFVAVCVCVIAIKGWLMQAISFIFEFRTTIELTYVTVSAMCLRPQKKNKNSSVNLAQSIQCGVSLSRLLLPLRSLGAHAACHVCSICFVQMNASSKSGKLIPTSYIVYIFLIVWFMAVW